MINQSVSGWVLACLMVLGAAFAIPSAQAFDLSLVGGVDFATPAVQTNGANTSGYVDKAAYGGGVLMGFDLNEATELEIGGLYMGRHFGYPGGEHDYYSYEIPVVLRLIPLKYVTFGIGPYYAIPTGQDSSTGTSATTHFQSDFGFLGSVGIKFPLSIATNFLVDGRYYYGVTNASKDAGETLHYRDAQILAGINFDF